MLECGRIELGFHRVSLCSASKPSIFKVNINGEGNKNRFFGTELIEVSCFFGWKINIRQGTMLENTAKS